MSSNCTMKDDLFILSGVLPPSDQPAAVDEPDQGAEGPRGPDQVRVRPRQHRIRRRAEQGPRSQSGKLQQA